MSEVMRVLGSLLVISVCGSPLYIRLASTSLRIPHSLHITFIVHLRPEGARLRRDGRSEGDEKG